MTRPGLSRGARLAAGALLVAAGVAAVGYVEWRFLPASGKPLDTPLALDRAGPVSFPPFAIERSGTYEIWLQIDHAAGMLNFGCLTTEPGFEKPCSPRKPELDLDWKVSSGGIALAHGATDIEAWERRGAAVPATEAAAAARRFQVYADRTDNPSDQTPFYHLFGKFRAAAGRRYALTLGIHRAAPTLAKLHPRLIVGLTAATARLGAWAVLFCVLCVSLGGFILLTALVPRKAPA
ncbi:MAG TPA: hypothetical protein VGB91_06435 [Rhizomicrobium sp.]